MQEGGAVKRVNIVNYDLIAILIMIFDFSKQFQFGGMLNIQRQLEKGVSKRHIDYCEILQVNKIKIDVLISWVLVRIKLFIVVLTI